MGITFKYKDYGVQSSERYNLMTLFQGTERDIIFLSMVAAPELRTALTMLRYEQRFNVAVSRARDRVVLVRSVRREDLNPDDLKARLIAHFESPMPVKETLPARPWPHANLPLSGTSCKSCWIGATVSNRKWDRSDTISIWWSKVLMAVGWR
jgi:hypothetical protein